jgi:hypothetical protein
MSIFAEAFKKGLENHNENHNESMARRAMIAGVLSEASNAISEICETRIALAIESRVISNTLKGQAGPHEWLVAKVERGNGSTVDLISVHGDQYGTPSHLIFTDQMGLVPITTKEEAEQAICRLLATAACAEKLRRLAKQSVSP